MKRKSRNLTGYALLALYGIAVGSLSAYVATKYASPCVCVVAQMRTIN